MKTLIRATTVAEIREFAALTEQHWREIALNKAVPLDVDWELFSAREAAGDVFCVGVFDASGAMVGYSVNYLFQHPHYRTVRMCQNDALFLSPTVRGGHVGVQLMNFTATTARSLGAKRMLWHAKKDTTLDRMLAGSKDYIVQDVIYSKEL